MKGVLRCWGKLNQHNCEGCNITMQHFRFEA